MLATAVDRPDSSLYPTLSDMGVCRFDEIVRYTLRQAGPDTDVLKLHYRRRRGSLLPVTRKYVFGRALGTAIADGGAHRIERTFEISPHLSHALAELDRLLGRDAARAARWRGDAKSRLLDDFHALAVEFAPKVPKVEAGGFFSRLHEIESRVRAL